VRKLRPDGRPICGGPNERGTATRKTECWCAAVKVLGEMPARVAEGVKGCLGFDICDSLLMDIIYTETRITLTRGDQLRREDLTPQVAERLLSMKFRDWSYEDEVRVFVRLEERDLVTGLYFRKFDERIRLAEAIAGHGCTVKRTEIKQAIGNDPKVDIIKARLAFKSFWVVKNERGFASS